MAGQAGHGFKARSRCQPEFFRDYLQLRPDALEELVLLLASG